VRVFHRLVPFRFHLIPQVPVIGRHRTKFFPMLGKSRRGVYQTLELPASLAWRAARPAAGPSCCGRAVLAYRLGMTVLAQWRAVLWRFHTGATRAGELSSNVTISRVTACRGMG